ncbi:MAG: hypothetical protein ACYTHJ_07265 [Planctomycetota bacterium]|jgi:hypothetical protein
MALGSLRRYDVQAKYAAVLAVLSTLPLLIGIVIAFRNYHHDVRQIIYRNNSYALTLAACLGVAMLLSSLAALLGFVSAGQRINERPGLSWLGFFLGGGVATLSLIAGIAFIMLRIQQPG